MVDFPGRLAAVIFLQGCPWRCPYCHNAHLRSRVGSAALTWPWVRGELERRRHFLEGVVFSGGEPTGQTGLGAALREVRELGLATGLHTAGIFPERLEQILPLLDWVGLDVKAPPDERYDRITGRAASARPFLRSLQLIQSSGVECELRTTVDPALLDERDCRDLQQALVGLGMGPTKWQEVRPAA